jgi:hypothetical protein
MLNIGRMAPGRADYYLTAVARGDDGVEGYYLARGEEPGRWLGHGAEQLGLSGEVTGRAAAGGARRPPPRRPVSSWPASGAEGAGVRSHLPGPEVGVAAVGARRPDTAAEVVAAHDAAVDAAIGYLQRAAGFTRRGAGGAETVPVDGFVAAAFRHRTSRADDPLLHTHVLVANLARTTDDGVWRTLDSRKLFAHAKTAGVLYQAHLRHELTRRLGVGGSRSVNGYADIDGVDRQLIETFSQRRGAIVEHMAAAGRDLGRGGADRDARDPAGQGRAALRGRAARRWTDRATAAGVRPGLASAAARHGPRGSVDLAAVATAGRRGRADRDLVVVHPPGRAAAARRPAARGRAGRVVERVADAFLTHDTDLLVALGPTRGHLTSVDVIRRATAGSSPSTIGRAPLHHQGAAAHRTAGHQPHAHGPHDDRVASPTTPMLERRRSSADADRRAGRDGPPAHHLRRRGGGGGRQGRDRQDLRARRRPRRLGASGIRVTGVALAARAALELEESAGIRSTTLAGCSASSTTTVTARRCNPGRCWWSTRPGWSAPASSPASSTTPNSSPSRSCWSATRTSCPRSTPADCSAP